MTPRTLSLVATAAALALSGCARMEEMLDGNGAPQQAALPTMAPATAELPPPAGFVNVSQISDLPEFVPGLGRLYVRPETLPEGPFLGYDRQGMLANTTYMIPLDQLAANQDFDDLTATTMPVDHVDVLYNPGHSGLPRPHYHVVLWHIPQPQEAQLME